METIRQIFPLTGFCNRLLLQLAVSVLFPVNQIAQGACYYFTVTENCPDVTLNFFTIDIPPALPTITRIYGFGTQVDYEINYGDGTIISGTGFNLLSNNKHTYSQNGIFTISVTYKCFTGAPECVYDPATKEIMWGCDPNVENQLVNQTVEIDCDSCCIGTFRPMKGKKYLLSAWASEENTTGVLNFNLPEIKITFSGSLTTFTFTPEGDIIDGWQKIEGEFIIPSLASDISISLINNSAGSAEVYFDDIRIHPFDANLKSFVYDPLTLRLMAELDENNYATYYEYDEDGALIRVKKETERGVKTIQASRSNQPK